MNLLAGVDKELLLESVVCTTTYNRALRLHQMEDYSGSNQALFEDFLKFPKIVREDVVSGDLLWSLVARNFFSLKEYGSIEELVSWYGAEASVEMPHLFLVFQRANLYLGKGPDALAICSEFIRNHSSPLDVLVADYLAVKGDLEHRFGSIDQALEDFEIAYSLFSFQGKLFEKAELANRLGIALRKKSGFFQSKIWLTRALSIFDSLKLIRKKSMVLLNLGVTLYKTGNLQKSHTTLLESHQIGIDGNWPHRQVFTNIALGNVLRMQRDYESARKCLHTGYAQAQDLGYPREEALALEFLGDVYRDEGHVNQAQRFYQRAMSIGESIAPVGDIVMECHRRIGECQASLEEYGDATQSLNKCLLLARKQGDRYEEAVALRIHGQIQEEQGNYEKASDHYFNSVELLDEIGARFELAISLQALANLKVQQVSSGQIEIPPHLQMTQAWTHITEALDHAIFTGVAPLIKEIRNLGDRISRIRNGLDLANQSGTKKGATKPNIIIHQSPVMRDLLQLTDLFAGTEEPVLITGETGTGKELIAKRLHMLSKRADKKLVSVNVTAIPTSMFEREMFGHVRGSFSGADRDGDGFVGEADGGTLFLDEIGELPAEVQPKLLRLLQEGTYQSLGDPAERQADIRILAATNASLQDKVDSGEFRKDLYFRLQVLGLELPPLRDRVGDVALLMNHFLSEAAGRSVTLEYCFDEESIGRLVGYHWPGNIRELEMLAKRVHVELMTRERVKVGYDSAGRLKTIFQNRVELRAMEAGAGDPAAPASDLSNSERLRILKSLEQCGGNRLEASKVLKMGRSTLYRKMRKYGL